MMVAILLIVDRFRSSLEHYFTMEARVPLVLVALNGGPNTIKTLVEGAY